MGYSALKSHGINNVVKNGNNSYGKFNANRAEVKGVEFWSVRIAWESVTHAQNGLNAFLTTEITKQMIPLVESNYSRFFGEAVVLV